MERVFVTGGSGFVGRNLIAALAKRGVAVRGLARSDGAAKTVSEAGAEVVRGDLDDVGVLSEGMRGCDVVFHAAALVKLWGDPGEFHRANVVGTQNVIDAAKSARVSRLVHVSTEALLGGGPPIVGADETWPYPARPIGQYATTKGESERRVLAGNGPDLATIAVRPPFIWGRGDTSVMPAVIRAVKRGEFMWFDGGNYPHASCNIDNVIEGLVLAAEKGRGGEIYFITDGTPVDFRKFVSDQLAAHGVAAPTRSMPLWLATLLARLCEVLWTVLPLKGDPPLTRSVLEALGKPLTVRDEKARQELGYVGRVTIAQGLAAMRSDR